MAEDKKPTITSTRAELEAYVIKNDKSLKYIADTNPETRRAMIDRAVETQLQPFRQPAIDALVKDKGVSAWAAGKAFDLKDCNHADDATDAKLLDATKKAYDTAFAANKSEPFLQLFSRSVDDGTAAMRSFPAARTTLEAEIKAIGKKIGHESGDFKPAEAAQILLTVISPAAAVKRDANAHCGK